MGVTSMSNLPSVVPTSGARNKKARNIRLKEKLDHGIPPSKVVINTTLNNTTFCSSFFMC